MKDLFYRYKNYILIGSGILFGVLIGISFFIFEKEEKQVAVDDMVILEEKPIDELKPSVEVKYVDIKGEINKPGVYEINTNARINDVIKIAGGLTKNADTKSLNLSKKVNDEMVIIVHSKNQIKDFITTKEEETNIIKNCIDSIYDVVNDGCINSNVPDVTESKLISINTASKEQLMKISGIGEKKAIEIINYRDLNGLFSTIDDIKNVNGIGEALFAQIKDFITT